MSARRLLLAAAAAALAGAFLVPLARADADPPSDFLISRDVYVPIFGGKPSDAAANELEDTVIAAQKAGYYIKVAVIGSRSDLGGVPQLWKNPTRYAPFLGRELTFVYQSRLLVAMPAGYGFYWPRHQTQAEQRLLDGRSVSADPDGLVRSTAGAVRALSAAAGYPIAKQGGSSSEAPPAWLVVAGVAIVVVLVGAPLVLRRRRPPA